MKDYRIAAADIDSLRIKAIIVALAGSILAPFIVHLFPPYQGVPLGAMLLPMFIAPFVAVLVSRFHVGLIAALLAPSLNALVTGHPDWVFIPVLTFELTVFVAITYLLNKNNLIHWVSAPLAYIAAKTVSSLTIWLFPAFLPQAAPVDFWLSSISNGLTGLVLLTLINVAVIKWKS